MSFSIRSLALYLSAPPDLAGQSNGASAPSGALTFNLLQLAGSSAGVATASGNIGGDVPLESQSDGVTSVIAAMDVIVFLEGVSAGSAVVAGSGLGLQFRIFGIVDGTTVVTGSLSGSGVSLAALVAGQSSLTGSLADPLTPADLAGPTDTQMTGVIFGQGGQQDVGSEICGSIVVTGQSNGGDGTIEWRQPMNSDAGAFVMPRPFSEIRLYLAETGQEIRRGRTEPWDGEWDGCSGNFTLKARGMAASMRDQTFKQETIFGPRPAGHSILALTPEGAIAYAVSQLCPGIAIEVPAATGVVLAAPSKDFLNANAIDVVEAMSALFAYLGTPYVWHVRPSGGEAIFSWKPMDLGARYQVTLGAGVKMGIHFDPNAIHNRFVVGWGKGQPIVLPDPVTEEISYEKIPIIHDKSINLTGQFTSYGAARNVARGMLAKTDLLRAGWSYTITVPKGAEVVDLATGFPTSPLLVQEGHIIRIVGMGAGNFELPPPEEHWITEVKYTGKDGQLVINCGETRAQESISAIRSVHAGTSIIGEPPPTDTKKRDTSDTGLWPVKLPITEAPINFRTELVDGAPIVKNKDEEHNPLPGAHFPNWATAKRPPVGNFDIDGSDLHTTGAVLPAILYVPPVKITRWELDANITTPLVVTFRLKSTDEILFRVQAGAWVDKPYGKSTSGTLATPKRILQSDGIYGVVTLADPSFGLLWASIGLRMDPLVPGDPDVEVDDDGHFVIVDWDGAGDTV